MADAVHTRYKDHARREYACHDQGIMEGSAWNHFIFHPHLLYSRLNRSLYPFRHRRRLVIGNLCEAVLLAHLLAYLIQICFCALFNLRDHFRMLISDFQIKGAASRNYVHGIRLYFDRSNRCYRLFIDVRFYDFLYLSDKLLSSHQRILTVCHHCTSGMVCLSCDHDFVTAYACYR